jgi:hypothetical protein
MKAEAEPGSPEDFQFFTTVGDNIYPKNESEPTKEELEESKKKVHGSQNINANATLSMLLFLDRLNGYRKLC